LKDHQDYRSNVLRLENQHALEEIIQSRLIQDDSEDIINILTEARVSCARVNDMEEAFSSKEVQALNMIIDSDGENTALVVGSPFHMNSMDEIKGTPAPSLGEHTDEVMKMLRLQ